MSVLLLVRPVAVSICLPGMLDRGCIIFVDFWPKGERTRKKCAAGIGLLNMLSMNGTNSYGTARNIAISGGTLYISGTEGTPSATSLCYWTGPTTGVSASPTDLSLGTGNSDWSLYWADLDSSGNFYLVGNVGGTSSSLSPCYWKITSPGENPTPTTLSTGPYTGGEACGIAFAGTHAYIAGTVGSQVPCYWKDGSFTALSMGANASENLQLMKGLRTKARGPTPADSGN